MAHDVFISYSSKDKKVADAVCAALESVKIRCWVAPRDVLAGEIWQEAIANAIEKSHIMVLIFSSNSNNSKDVSKELVLAMNMAVTVIPLRIEDVQPKGVMKYYLSDTHWLDALNPPTKNQIDNIVETVSLLVYKEKGDTSKQNIYKKEDESLSPKREKEIPDKKVKLSKSNRLVIILVSVMFVAIIATVFIVIGNNNKINKTNAASETSAVETATEKIAAETQKEESVEIIENTKETITETANSEEAATKDDKTSSIIGSCDTPGNAYEVHVKGDYAYIADGSAGLQVIDITDKENPYISGSCKTTNNAWEVYVEGNYAYIADTEEGLQIIDITDKENPHFVGSYSGRAQSVYVEENYAYVAGGDGLYIIDITDKENPNTIGSYKFYPDFTIKSGPSKSTSSVYVEGNYAYITVGSSEKGVEISEMGLEIIDITDKENPHIASSCNTPKNPVNVYIEGKYAYMSGSGLQIIDITNKENPNIMGTCDGGSSGIFIEGNYAYLTNGVIGLEIIDITNKENPNIIATCGTPGEPWDVYVEGNYAYIADNEEGLQIIDTSIRKD